MKRISELKQGDIVFIKLKTTDLGNSHEQFLTYEGVINSLDEYKIHFKLVKISLVFKNFNTYTNDEAENVYINIKDIKYLKKKIRIIKNFIDILSFVQINFNTNTLVALLIMFLLLPLTLVTLFYQDTKMDLSNKYKKIEDAVIMISLIMWLALLIIYTLASFMKLMVWFTA